MTSFGKAMLVITLLMLFTALALEYAGMDKQQTGITGLVVEDSQDVKENSQVHGFPNEIEGLDKVNVELEHE